MIHNDPPIARITPLQNDLDISLHDSDSRINKKTNHLWLKIGKEPVNGADVLKKPRKKRSDYEDKVLQPAFARHMDGIKARLGDEIHWTHIGHGGRKHIGVAMMHKRAGLKPGILDNQVYFQRNNLPQVLFIEVKEEGKGDLTDGQKDFIRIMTDLGHKCYVIYAKHPVDLVRKLNTILRDNGVMV